MQSIKMGGVFSVAAIVASGIMAWLLLDANLRVADELRAERRRQERTLHATPPAPGSPVGRLLATGADWSWSKVQNKTKVLVLFGLAQGVGAENLEFWLRVDGLIDADVGAVELAGLCLSASDCNLPPSGGHSRLKIIEYTDLLQTYVSAQRTTFFRRAPDWTSLVPSFGHDGGEDAQGSDEQPAAGAGVF